MISILYEFNWRDAEEYNSNIIYYPLWNPCAIYVDESVSCTEFYAGYKQLQLILIINDNKIILSQYGIFWVMSKEES